MGDWTEITVGNVDVMSFKNRIPLYSVLMFDESDLQYDIEREPIYNDDGNEIIGYEEERLYKFKSTVKKVKQVLANRGIDEDFCCRTFDTLRASIVWVGGEDEEVPNTVDYSIYKQLLQARLFPTNSVTTQDSDFDEFARYRAIEEALFESDYPSFFWGEHGHAFDEELTVVYLRTIFDVAPENAEVTLAIAPLTNYEGMYETLYGDFVAMMLRKIELDYHIYGFVIHNDPNIDIRLQSKIERLSEDSFINQILIPLMRTMGFADVKPVSSHGQGEFGKDILPFRKISEFNTMRYVAVQAKAVSIHGSAGKSGNAGELLTQALNAFRVAFFDGSDNERKRIDEFVIATNKDVKAEAKRTIEEGIEGDRRITFLDLYRVVELIKRYKLIEYVLFSIVEETN